MAENLRLTAPGALDVINVGLVYGEGSSGVEALRSVSFVAHEGEFVSLLGPSGCGKSSLLKLVLGLETATSGEIRISGRPINGPTKDVGCVFQAPVLLPWRNIRDNVLLPIDVMKLDRGPTIERAEALLRLVGLGGFEDRYPYELSGGMQQRAAVVRALVHDPRILMMDEPFAALDAMTREQMAIELQRIWMESHKTMVFVTHAVAEAVVLSDRIIVMSPRPGRIAAVFENKAERPRSFKDLGSPYLNGLMDDIRECLDRATSE